MTVRRPAPSMAGGAASSAGAAGAAAAGAAAASAAGAAAASAAAGAAGAASCANAGALVISATAPRRAMKGIFFLSSICRQFLIGLARLAGGSSRECVSTLFETKPGVRSPLGDRASAARCARPERPPDNMPKVAFRRRGRPRIPDGDPRSLTASFRRAAAVLWQPLPQASRGWPVLSFTNRGSRPGFFCVAQQTCASETSVFDGLVFFLCCTAARPALFSRVIFGVTMSGEIAAAARAGRAPARRPRRERRWCLGADSNHRHADFQSAALPTELPRRSPRREEPRL